MTDDEKQNLAHKAQEAIGLVTADLLALGFPADLVMVGCAGACGLLVASIAAGGGGADLLLRRAREALELGASAKVKP